MLEVAGRSRRAAHICAQARQPPVCVLSSRRITRSGDMLSESRVTLLQRGHMFTDGQIVVVAAPLEACVVHKRWDAHTCACQQHTRQLAGADAHSARAARQRLMSARRRYGPRRKRSIGRQARRGGCGVAAKRMCVRGACREGAPTRRAVSQERCRASRGFATLAAPLGEIGRLGLQAIVMQLQRGKGQAAARNCGAAPAPPRSGAVHGGLKPRPTMGPCGDWRATTGQRELGMVSQRQAGQQEATSGIADTGKRAGRPLGWAFFACASLSSRGAAAHTEAGMQRHGCPRPRAG